MTCFLSYWDGDTVLGMRIVVVTFTAAANTSAIDAEAVAWGAYQFAGPIIACTDTLIVFAKAASRAHLHAALRITVVGSMIGCLLTLFSEVPLSAIFFVTWYQSTEHERAQK